MRIVINDSVVTWVPFGVVFLVEDEIPSVNEMVTKIWYGRPLQT